MTTISMKDAITDITRNVTTTGFFDKVKITAGKQGTAIEAIEKDKQVILKGMTLKPVDGWNGEFGLSNLGLLSSIVNNSEFTHKDSTLELVTAERDGVEVPTEFQYTNKSKSFISYRFIAKSVVPEQPKYSEPTWDVKIKPSKNSIQQFNWAASSLGAYEQYFIPKTVDGELKFFIGEETAATQRGGVVFATDVKGKFESNHKWPIAMVYSILKLVDGTDAEMSFSTKGAIQIKLNTGISEYRYIFPAKIR